MKPQPPKTRHVGIFNASNARGLSESYEKHERVQGWVFRKIKRTAKRGYHSCTVNTINETTKKEVLKRGFGITKSNSPGVRQTYINW